MIQVSYKILPKIVIKLPRTYEKRNCKGEPYLFSDYRDPSVQTDTDHVTFKEDNLYYGTKIIIYLMAMSF